MIRMFYVIGLLGVIALVLFFGWWAIGSLREHYGDARASFAIVTVWLAFLIASTDLRRRSARR